MQNKDSKFEQLKEEDLEKVTGGSVTQGAPGNLIKEDSTAPGMGGGVSDAQTQSYQNCIRNGGNHGVCCSQFPGAKNCHQ